MDSFGGAFYGSVIEFMVLNFHWPNEQVVVENARATTHSNTMPSVGKPITWNDLMVLFVVVRFVMVLFSLSGEDCELKI